MLIVFVECNVYFVIYILFYINLLVGIKDIDNKICYVLIEVVVFSAVEMFSGIEFEVGIGFFYVGIVDVNWRRRIFGLYYVVW